MKISGKWQKPIELGWEKGTTFFTDLSEIPAVPGIYVFTCSNGDSHRALYVGKAGKLRNRIKQQLNNNKLMTVLAESGKGRKLLFFCEVSTKAGQTSTKNIKIVEEALIEQFLLNGHSLVNDKGTKRPTHTISFSGSKAAYSLVGEKSLEIRDL